MDDRVLQLAIHPLDLADVDVLDGVAVRVHLHGAARRVADGDPAERGHDRAAILRHAAHSLDRLGDDPGARVAVLGVEGRHAVVGLFEGGPEAAVGRRVE